MKNKISSTFKNKAKYYAIYTLVFVLCCLVIFSYFYLNGKTIINYVDDGLFQHFQSQLYISKHIKTILTNIFVNHKLVIPQWDFSIGEGSDIISSLHSDAFGDPITALAVLFSNENMYVFYALEIIIKIYLGGIFFSELCFYTKINNKYSVLAGSIVYDFCFYSLINIVEHNYFFTPLMYLPLIILGVEKIINDDKPYCMIIGVFLSAISQLYFFFMVVMITVIYVLVRLLMQYKLNIKTIIKKVLKIFIYSLLGLLMSSIIVLPMIYTYMSDYRMGVEIQNSLLYPFFYYERLLAIFLSNDNAYDLCLGFAAPTLFALFLTLKNCKRDKLLLVLNIIALICISVPLCGKVFNGFRFVSSRWCFTISLLVAYTFAYEWEDIEKNQVYLIICGFVVFGFACVSAWSRTDRVLIPLCFAFLFLLIVNIRNTKYIFNIDIKQTLLVAIVTLNVFYIADSYYSYRGKGMIDDVLSIEDAENLMYNTETYAYKNYIQDNEKDAFVRYTGDNLLPNNAMLHNAYSTDYYWSITNPYDQDFRMKLDLTNRCSWMIKGYENRTELNTLSNIKYFVSKSEKAEVPFGFNHDGTKDGYHFYKNDYYVPFGYSYENTMSYDDWNKLDVVSKQEALMQSMLVDKESTNTKVTYDNQYIPFKIECDENIKVENNTIIVKQKDAGFKLKFNGLVDCENYLIIEGLNFEDVFGLIEDDHTESKIELSNSLGQDNTVYYLTQSHHYYYGKQDYAISFGYSNDPITEISITFSLPGQYTYKDLKVNCLSLINYDKYTNDLSKDYLQNAEIGINRVSGTVNLTNKKYMLLSIPYSKGWKAKVDGESVDLLQANIHYIGLELDKGSHNIELTYETPLLKLGTIISGISICGFILFVIFNEKKKV